jgi:chromate transport protein ChrA
MEKKRHYRHELFLTFAGIGLFTFGVGYAMISQIQDICVGYEGHDNRLWCCIRL